MSYDASHTVSVAPMMEWTDRHCRYFLRRIAPSVRLYTEMVTAQAVLHGDRERLLGFEPAEHPVAVQLGGSEPAMLAEAARIAAGFGYDEINLNVGCPSDRVQSGRFGACLMAEPDLVAACVSAMRAAVSVPVTVKCRLGIDDQPEWETLSGFVRAVAAAGCEHVVVHARKAWLNGLSPKENRDVPPLRYELVYRLKALNPRLTVILNGGVRSLTAVQAHLRYADGVMLGRAAYHDPWILAGVEREVFGTEPAVANRAEAVRAMLPYIERQCGAGVPLHAVTRHMLGLFQGEPGARHWRRHLSEGAHRAGAGPELVEAALSRMDAVADAVAAQHPKGRAA